MAIEASIQHADMIDRPILPSSTYKLRDIQVNRPMVISQAPIETSLVLRPHKEGTRASSKTWNSFAVSSWSSESGWIEHCQGMIAHIPQKNQADSLNGDRTRELQQASHEARIRKFHEKCTTHVEPEDVYAGFARGGLNFGPVFRNVIAARATKDCSICTVSVPDTAAKMPKEYETPYLIHPGTFDACLQALVCAANGGDMSKLDTYVPTFVEEIELRHDLLPNRPGDRFEVYGSRHRPFEDLDSDIHGSFIAARPGRNPEVFLEISGFVGSTLPNDSVHSEVGDRRLCYETLYEPSIDMMTPEQFNKVFRNTSDSAEALNQIQGMERAAFHYLEDTFSNAAGVPDEPYSGHLEKLRQVALGKLALGKQGQLRFQTPEWLSCSNTEKHDFLTRLASSDSCGQLLCALGDQYSSIMNEEIEPLSIMIQENKLEVFYRNLESSRGGYESSTRILRTLIHQNPNMRILEIGAGTGAQTTPSLRGLGHKFQSYDFTDISSGFFPKAKEEFEDWGDMIQYKKLNIEDDPFTQGFEPEAYDLVIAANVLHATTNMTRTMHNVRALLRPGGKALISEVTAPSLSNLFIFGTLPGWWLGDEVERQEGPILSEENWHTLLKRTGFSGLDGSLETCPGGIDVGRLMLTTAIPEQTTPYSPTSILFCGEEAPALVRTVCDYVDELGAAKTSASNILKVRLQNQYAIVLAMEDTFWSVLDEEGLNRMKLLFSATRGLLWVTRGARSQNPAANMMAGLIRSVRKENVGIQLVTLDLDGEEILPNGLATEAILHVYRSHFGSNTVSLMPDFEFTEIQGSIHIARVYPDTGKDRYVERHTRPPVPELQPFYQEGRPLKAKLGQAGLLDSIHFIEDPQAALQEHDIEISVRATGMNFKDVMIGLGQIPQYHEMGLECSGLVTNTGSKVTNIAVGDYVCGLTKGAYSNNVRISEHLVTKFPPRIDFVQAASLPVVFCTAYYALYETARLIKGESILIHSAAGGVGQAAIMLAQRAQAQIFVTVGTADKKSLMLDHYQISSDHIFSSRGSFQSELMRITKGKGVDVILNFTAGETLRQSWRCLAPLGRFIEIGKRDLVLNNYLEMGKFAEGTSFSAIDIGLLSEQKPHAFKLLLETIMELFRKREIQTVSPITVYSISEIEQAMRIMSGGKHMGKIIIEARSDDVVQALPSPIETLVKNPNSTYLITGGTGGLGRSIIKWLASQGAKHIVTASRSGMKQAEMPALVAQLQGKGINLVVEECDISCKAQVSRLVSKCYKTLPPINGVIHGAMALRDALFENISYFDWALNIAPRVDGAWNLHSSLSNSELDFFIILASGSGILGYAGQAAYAASNTFLDSFTSYRNNLGLPTSVIDIGLVEGVGYVAQNPDRAPEITRLAHDRLTEAELLSLVRGHISREDPVFQTAHKAQTLTGYKLLPDRPLPAWFPDPRFAHLLPKSHSSTVSRNDSRERVKELLRAADCLEVATELALGSLRKNLSTLLMMKSEDVDVQKPVVAYGMDSLVAVELLSAISRDLEASVPLMDLMGAGSLEALAGTIVRRSGLVDKAMVGEEIVWRERETRRKWESRRENITWANEPTICRSASSYFPPIKSSGLVEII